MRKFYFLITIMIVIGTQAQIHYSQNWNTTGLNGWTVTDLNSDGKNWANINAGGINAAFGTGSLVSFSWSTNPITPNNLATSPLINLTTASPTNLVLLYNLATDATYPAEKYSVYITTTNVATSIIATTPVLTETLATGGFKSRSIDLSAYAGQQVYVSFRHYDCYDQYYLIIDDVNVKNIMQNDVQLSNVDLKYFGVINTNYSIKAKVKNNGSNIVSNVTINWNDGTDHSAVIPVNNLATGAEETITHTIPVTYPTLVEKDITVTLTQTNGVADATPTDNTGTTKFKTVSQNSTKKVLIEEGTGTWCGWCPRGAVAMAYMDVNYPNNFIGIAVHKGGTYPDPMEVTEYATGTGISSFPGMNVDRIAKGVGVSQLAMETYVNDRKNLVVPASLDGSGTMAAGVLTFNASATFRTNYTGVNLRFAAILMEDNVSGTTSGYNQTNYYAGGTNGVMGGYELLANPVPAASMVYDHVGRMLISPYAGTVGSIPSTITDGQVVNYTYNVTIPTTYNMSNLKVVLMLLNGTTGEVINARSFLLSALLSTVDATNKNYLTLYPNPTTDYIKIQAERNVNLQIFDASGKLVLEKSNIIPDQKIDVSGLSSGVYFVKMQEEKGNTKTQKLIIK